MAGQRAAQVAAARSYAGVPCSAADCFAPAAHRFRLSFGPFAKGDVADSRHMICSQLVDRCYLDAGVTSSRPTGGPGVLTPADLWSLLRS
ncbi:hypothetical protein KNE206_10450 [Kitasatospora sp. NE20-6]